MIILISGEKNSGKTTIVNRLAKEFDVDGLITEEYFENSKRYGFIIRNLYEKPLKENLIAKMDEDFKPIVYSDVFENIGVNILKNLIQCEKEIIVIDEIGTFEKNSKNYKKHLQKLFDCGKIIVAVLKYKDDKFLDFYREKYNVLMINTENRDEIFKNLKKQIGNERSY